MPIPKVSVAFLPGSDLVANALTTKEGKEMWVRMNDLFLSLRDTSAKLEFMRLRRSLAKLEDELRAERYGEKRFNIILGRAATILRNLPRDLTYHNSWHTASVEFAARRYAALEGVKGRELELLLVATLFHDTGFTTVRGKKGRIDIDVYEKNAHIGAEIALITLADLLATYPQYGFNYSKEELELVKRLILVTDHPERAQTLLERIMVDSDVDYIGRDTSHFVNVANRLRSEWAAYKEKRFPDREWYKLQLDFLSRHTFRTDAAEKLGRNEGKSNNIAWIKGEMGVR